MRALDPDVTNDLWERFSALLPEVVDAHPLGCHRPRVDDRVCFDGIVIRLVTGCSWETTERLLGGIVSDTTLRTRRDEWIDAGVFDQLAELIIGIYDADHGLDLTEVGVDGSQHKAPCGGAGTGPSPVDRAKRGWKWSIAVDGAGIPIGWCVDQANRNDCKLLEPTLDDVTQRGFTGRIGRLHLDRGYDFDFVRDVVADAGIKRVDIQRRRRPGEPKTRQPLRLGLRWPVERTNSWLTNFGQLRRNTDRQTRHRHAQLALAISLIITVKLLDNAPTR